MRKLQKFASISLAFCIAIQAHAAQFADVSGTGYEDAYTYLSTKNIVEQGRPYSYLNRAEAVKIVISARKETSKRAMWY